MDRAAMLAAAFVIVAAACDARTPREPAVASSMTEGERESAAGTPNEAATSVIPPEQDPQEPLLLVTDPEVLMELERSGFGLGELVFASQSGESTRAMTADRGYASIRKVIERDMNSVLRQDPKAGVGMRHAHRAFDVAWLDSDKTRFEMIAVVNRTDRRPFAPDKCGETRLVYRLAYRSAVDGTEVNSRLPMTVNVVHWQEAEDCREAARRWYVPRDAGPATIAEALRAGPLSAAQLDGRLKSVEVNFQKLRWPGVMHPSLGGNAEYILRVFSPKGERFEPTPLENVPDVARLKAQPELKATLRDWIADNLADIDAGIAVMPPELADDIAVSAAPRGMARLANRPFSQLFDADELAELHLDGARTIRSPRGLLRRLDGMTCNGCHETRSVAGFHIVGERRPEAPRMDAAAVATSAHLFGDLSRRRAFVESMADTGSADPHRPLSDFEPGGGYGAHCGLGDPSFEDLRCSDGMRCAQLDDADLGTCLPADRPSAGDPCEMGELRTRIEGPRDRVRNATISDCDSGDVCNRNAVGFPTGMCTASCSGLDEGERCGAIVDFTTFNNCVGARKPFPRCIEKAAGPAGLRACDESNRCREDYLCAESPSADGGVCIPPYFLFQMRVDGHVM